MKELYDLLIEYYDIKFDAPIPLPNDFVFDEEKSVRWNREKLAEEQAKWNEYVKSEEVRNAQDAKLNEKFNEILDAIKHCPEFSGVGVSSEHLNALFTFADHISDETFEDFYRGFSDSVKLCKAFKVHFIFDFIRQFITGDFDKMFTVSDYRRRR